MQERYSWKNSTRALAKFREVQLQKICVATQLVNLSVFSNDLFLRLPTLSFLYLAGLPLGRMRRKDSAGLSFTFIQWSKKNDINISIKLHNVYRSHPEMEITKNKIHQLRYRFQQIFKSITQPMVFFLKVLAFLLEITNIDNSLETFGLVLFFLRFKKSIGLYGFSSGFQVVLFIFHQCLISICTNIRFIKMFL